VAAAVAGGGAIAATAPLPAQPIAVAEQTVADSAVGESSVGEPVTSTAG
jgi:hypothetical protein